VDTPPVHDNRGMKPNQVELPTAADIMVTRVATFSPQTEIAEAVESLLDHGYSGAPIVDAHNRPIGVLSEHDCARVLAVSIYEGWPTGTVADHMTKTTDAIEPHTDLLAIAQRFAEGRHRRLLVVQEAKLVGLITRRDLLRSLDRVRQRMDTRREPNTYELIQARRWQLGEA
jgi:CBS domain-containing protein